METTNSGVLESIIERRKPESEYHRRCMQVLDNTLPQDILNGLQLAVIEAAAEEEKQVNNGHAALVTLGAGILAVIACDKWDADGWQDAVLTRNIPTLEQHLALIADSKQYDKLNRAVIEFLWQNVYFDAIQGVRQAETKGAADQTVNITYYLGLFFGHTERTLGIIFDYLTDTQGRMPRASAEVVIPAIADAIETIIREATATQ